MKPSFFMSLFATFLLTALTVNFSSNYHADNNTKNIIVFAGVNGHGAQSHDNNDSNNQNTYRKHNRNNNGGQEHGVPEPLTIALVAGGLVGFGLYRKYKKNDGNTDKEID